MKKKAPGLIRLIVWALAVILQISLLVLPYIFLWNYSSYIQYAFNILSIFLVLFIVRKDESPAYKIPWIVLFMLFPVFAWILYLVFGIPHRMKKTRKHLSRLRETAWAKLVEEDTANEQLKNTHFGLYSQAEYLKDHAGAVAWQHTKTDYYPLGDYMLEPMLEDLRSAEEYIYMEYFIVEDGQMWEAIYTILKDKAGKGVDVRFMFDSFGSMTKVNRAFREEVEEAGIHCQEFGKFRYVVDSRYNNRDHRKICVVDGRVGYTGGVNLADEYINRKVVFGHWKDTAIRLEGEAVLSMTIQFLEHWAEAGGQEEDYSAYHPIPYAGDCENGYVAPYVDFPGDAEYVCEAVYLNMINHAHHYVYLSTPYLVLDDVLQAALMNAAKCGVDVRILVPGVPDKKTVFTLTQSYYPKLIRAGVRIYQYDSGFVHAKMMVADDETATIGTANLDFRSLVHQYEDGVWMAGTTAVQAIHKDFMDTFTKCHPVTLQECHERAWWKRAFLPLLRLLSPMI